MADEKATPVDLEAVKITNPGFIDKVTPKDPKDLMMLVCSKVEGKAPGDGPYREGMETKCGGIHFRHAGYVQNVLPFMMPNQEKKVELHNYQVMVCVKCKSCYIWVSSQLYDITHQIDLKAWEATEKELHKATGPGGQC